MNQGVSRAGSRLTKNGHCSGSVGLICQNLCKNHGNQTTSRYLPAIIVCATEPGPNTKYKRPFISHRHIANVLWPSLSYATLAQKCQYITNGYQPKWLAKKTEQYLHLRRHVCHITSPELSPRSWTLVNHQCLLIIMFVLPLQALKKQKHYSKCSTRTGVPKTTDYKIKPKQKKKNYSKLPFSSCQIFDDPKTLFKWLFRN